MLYEVITTLAQNLSERMAGLDERLKNELSFMLTKYINRHKEHS